MSRNVGFFIVVMFMFLSLGDGSVVAAPFGVIDVNDPNGLDSKVNSLGVGLTEEVGNYGSVEFSAHPRRLVLTIDTSNGYPPETFQGGEFDRIGTVFLTLAGGSPVDLNILFENPRDSMGGFTDEENNEGYTRIILDDPDLWRTSGDQSLAYSMYTDSTAKIVFDSDVYGVGFAINRLQADMTIKLLDSSDVQIGSDYTVGYNDRTGHPDYQTNHSFFGYYKHTEAEIRAVEFSLGGVSNQYSIDDVVIVADTEGLPSCYGFAIESDVNEDCFVDLVDFSLLAKDWLVTTPVE